MVHVWTDSATSEAAMRSWACRQEPGPDTALGEPGPSSLEVQRSERSQLWFAPPARWRFESRAEGSEIPFIQIVNGSKWWLYNPIGRDSVVKAGEDSPSNRFVSEYPPFAAMWDLDLLDESLVRVGLAEETYVGRHCLRERATPRVDLADDEYGGIWPGATEHELLIDAEHQVVIRWIAWYQSRFYGGVELEAVAFNDVFDPSLFDAPAEERLRIR